jgi:hypothetical protein
MKRYALLAFLFMSPWSIADDDTYEALPQWSEEDLQRISKGEALISDSLFRLQEGSDQGTQDNEALVLPEPGPDSLTIVPATEILEEDLVKYFGQKADSFLLDPQQLLTQQESNDRLAFLNYHASDSKVDFYVYLFDEQQEIPSIIQVDELLAKYYSSDRPALILFYFLGAPQRSEIHLSPKLMVSVGEAERERALQSSINQAIVKSQASDQLDGFCVQMSIRIYWMEKAMESGVIAPVTPVDTLTKKKNLPGNNEKMKALSLWFMQWRLPLAFGFFVSGVAIVFTWIRKKREKFTFAEFDVACRLGGPHAAGVGAVISYASAKLPPTMQREQVPDYLRRM